MALREVSSLRIIPYDGHRSGVKPMKIIDEKHTRDILEIEQSWVETGVELESPIIHGFVVRCIGGARYRIIHHSEDGWFASELPGPRIVE